ncbi:MAG: PQQ-like beta-propeller repeat protein [Phycisphaerae bacterium]|nr:PQQ-like beta-propeller repeat protein [Phycisphaerae bacterium]
MAASRQGCDDDWPTYRHDARRSGATVCDVPPQVSPRWRVRLPGRLTPPTVSGDRVYVAAKDEQTLYAFGAQDGRRLWHYTAGGRIDSPATIYGELVLFGCADAGVYCLRASDGELLWRFLAAPSDQRIVALGQLESPWRVHGSVLVKDGVAYCTAGRSTYLDGGIRIFGLDPKTGKVVYKTCLDTWARTRKDAENKAFVPAYHMEGTNSDILVSEADYIYLGQYKFDHTLARQQVPYVMPDPDNKTVAMDLMNQPFVENMESQKEYEKVQHDWQWRVHREMMEDYQKRYGGASMGDRNMGLHVFSTSGFLDDSWFNRTFWMYSATWPGFYIAHRASKTGQLLVVGAERTYGVQAYPSRNLQSPLFTPGKKGYLLFADENDNEPVLVDYTRGVPKGIGFTRKEPPAWFKWVPIRIRGMVLAGRHLFVAGPPDVVDPDDPMAAFEGRKGAALRVFSVSDGSVLAEHKLEAPPVFDGLIAANGQLYLSLNNGTVLRMGPER